MMGMGRWNSKCYQTRVKGFKVQRQKEEISLDAGRRIEGPCASTKEVTVKNCLIKFKVLPHRIEGVPWWKSLDFGEGSLDFLWPQLPTNVKSQKQRMMNTALIDCRVLRAYEGLLSLVILYPSAG
ncbi:hypothetical protein AVEN_34606-1 [Araneus ventricosus]|uniref:Uncharacterized protein n=1 Tax=Araneus ventricosus TaxID=182803 RepID=A0A4Y2B0Q2_ARAVE|nr:hypothetical protein AVEN_34606-1 [Araneus ventricosus]